MKSVMGFVALSLLVGTVASAIPVTSFSFTSSPSSWVGGGATRTMTPADGYSFTVQSIYNMSVVSFSIHTAAYTDSWYLDFASGSGQPLVEGSYPNATRYPFNGSGPGLAFLGNGRGDNTLTGDFTVLDATYDANGTVLSFAAQFTQYDEGNPNAWNRGLIQYNYSASVPDTSNSLPLLGLALLGCLVPRALRFGGRLSAKH